MAIVGFLVCFNEVSVDPVQRRIEISSHNPVEKLRLIQIEMLSETLISLSAFNVFVWGAHLRRNGSVIDSLGSWHYGSR